LDQSALHLFLLVKLKMPFRTNIAHQKMISFLCAVIVIVVVWTIFFCYLKNKPANKWKNTSVQ